MSVTQKTQSFVRLGSFEHKWDLSLIELPYRNGLSVNGFVEFFALEFLGRNLNVSKTS